MPDDNNPLLALVTAAADAAGGTDELAQDVYAALFWYFPETRVMFPSGMEQQRDKFVKRLLRILTHAYDVDTNEVRLTTEERRAVERLAVDHLKFGIHDHHYEDLGRALVFALGWRLWEVGRWTADALALLETAYGALAKTMKDAAAGWLAAGNPRWVDARVQLVVPGEHHRSPVVFILGGFVHRMGDGTGRGGVYRAAAKQRVSVSHMARPGDWVRVVVLEAREVPAALVVSVDRDVADPAVSAFIEGAHQGDLVRLEAPNPVEPVLVEDQS
jgi:hemoglobin-like flavoprotein